MSQVTLKQLLEAGVHFGHQTQRWNPKMKKYIFGERNGIYIINLEITLGCIEKAMAYLQQLAADGKDVLFVGTKKQAQEPLREGAEKSGMPYVNQRWLGGMLTNFETVRKSVSKLDNIDRMEQDGSFQFVTKKEVLTLKKEREKLMKNLLGIRNMRRLPSALFVVDSKKEEIAIREAMRLGIPVVAVLDTNCDPDIVNYPIPGNDDAIRAVKLFCDLASNAVKSGREKFLAASAPKAVPAESAEGQSAEGGSETSMAQLMEEVFVDETIEEKLAERFVAPEVDEDEAKMKSKKPVRVEKGGRAKK